MAWKNKLTLTAMLLLVSPLAGAVTNVLWRVSSDVTDTVLLPSYTGATNPFPMQVKPQQVEAKPVRPVVERAQITETQRRSMLASEVLADIRDLLQNGDIFNPDISGAAVSAHMVGSDGALVLIRDTWFGEGDMMEVPVTAKQRLFELLDLLKTLDRSLHDIVEVEVEERLADAGDLKLKIAKIHDTYVELEDTGGNTHVLQFK